MFNKEDGPTALRAELVRGLSLSSGAQEIRTNKGVERAFAGVASVWNGSRGFVIVVIRFLKPPRVDRYTYSQLPTDESMVIRAEAEALSFARALGFSMDEPAFRELDEESRQKRLHNWNLIRKVRESSRGVEEMVAPPAAVESATESEHIPCVAPEPPDSLELALAGGPGDDDTPVEFPSLGDAPADDDTPLELAPITAAPSEDERLELAPVTEAPPEDVALELAPVTEAPPEDVALELAPVTEASPEDVALELTLRPGNAQPVGVEPEELVLEPAVPEAELDLAEARVVEAIEPPAETAGAFEIVHEPDFLGASTEEEGASEPDVLEFVDSEPAASDPPTFQLTTSLTPGADAVESQFTLEQLGESAELDADSRPPGIESAAVAANEGHPTVERAAARDTGGAVIGKIELVRREGADRRRLSALSRLLTFF